MRLPVLITVRHLRALPVSPSMLCPPVVDRIFLNQGIYHGKTYQHARIDR